MLTLIIVDCQNDFISGTMRIKDASTILEAIKKFIKDNKSEIEEIIFTVEWHPYNHCSFKRNGGSFPQHCVQYTPGACIEPKLLKFVQSININYQVDFRGTLDYFDQLGAFEDIDYIEDASGYRYYFDSVVEANAKNDFIICGITEPLIESVQNLLSGGITPKVFIDGTIDGKSKSFNSFIKENNLEKV